MMTVRIADTHQRLTRIGDWLDLAADWIIAAGVYLSLFALGAMLGVAILAAVLQGLGVWQ